MSTGPPARRRALLSRPRTLRPRTLRARIVVSTVAMLVVGFAAVGVLTTVVVHRVLLDRLDAQLRAAGTRFAVGLEHNDHDGDNDPSQFGTVEGQSAGTLGARLSGGVVTVGAVVGRHDSSAISSAARSTLASLTPSSKLRSVWLAGLGEYRLLVANGRDNDVQITGLPMEPVEETTDRLVLIEAVIFAAALAVVAAGIATLVRRTLRPLARVADTAARVANLPLATGTVSLPDRAPVERAGSEVATVTAAFNTMLEQVESALVQRHGSEERLRRFVADASHELRTPVAVIRSHAEFAQRVGGDNLPEEVGHALERITAQSERMSHLVEDLLLLARLDSGRPLARDAVDLTRVVLDAVTDLRVAGPEHHWQLELPDSAVVVLGDEHGLHQAVANLLANARVHTPPGTHVTASVRLDDSGDVVVTVSDDGPGIPPEVSARVFERFVRGDTRRLTSTGSSGLGLPIVGAIIAAHHGQVDVSSAEDGTRVTVTLPLFGRDDDDSDDVMIEESDLTPGENQSLPTADPDRSEKARAHS